MRLTRQLALLLGLTLLLAVVGAVGLQQRAAHESLLDQLRIKNQDAAQSLALVLSQRGLEATERVLLVQALADTGHYRSVRLLGPDGQVLHDSSLQDPGPSPAPAWFRRLWPLEAPPGVAQVSDGWTVVGRVELQSHAADLQAAMWRGSVATAAWLLLLAAVTALVGAIGLRRVMQPLQATVAQADALSQRRYLTQPLPRVPELRRVASAMNHLVGQVQRLFDHEADELERWRRQAHADRLTGLPNRDHFLDRLTHRLGHERGPGVGRLTVLRVADLARHNREQGHAAVDEALVAMAATLKALAAARPDGLAGRLNGSDFALWLPESGLSPAELTAALKAALAGAGLDASLHLGQVSAGPGQPVGARLAAADAALAAAEAGLPRALWPSVDQDGAPVAAAPALGGEQAWRVALGEALARPERLSLGAFPVVDASGRELHLECPLRVRLADDQPPSPASRWLPLARRSGWLPALDEQALRLALEGIAADGRARAVHLAVETLAAPGLAGRLQRRLARAPEAAARLIVEVPPAALQVAPAALQSLAEALRPLGVRFALEHAVGAQALPPGLLESGLTIVKLDAASTAGLVARAELRAFVARATRLLQVAGLTVLAEGVVDEAQAQALAACGVQGWSGPVVRPAV